MKMQAMPEQVKKSLVLSIYFALAVSALLVFWQVRNFDFVNYDDDDYVSANPHVLNGLTVDSVWWAFTTGHAANWHPLTWLSLMLDCQLFGPSPAGFHLTNLFFHIANTLLLFLVLKQMTKAIWQSAFAAALFALHPMHVESVAWITERKDVLSTFFWLLAMLAYAQYVKQPSASRYLLVLLIFALGLMAKPMLVTLPFVFLLLDYWPLERIRNFNRQIIYRLILEKVPFFAISVISGVITFFVQQSGGTVNDILSLNKKVANVFLSYVQYISKMFWPSNLAVFYPFNARSISFGLSAICALLLLVISVFILYHWRRQKYLPMGWFWFVGTLAPVIGFIQVGRQAYADRYTYIPYIGLFIMLAWGLPQLLSKWISASPQRKIALGLSMVIVLTALGICAHRQVSFWKNRATLFSHAIEVTQNNYIAYNNLGAAYDKLGRWTEATDVYKQAIKIKPDLAEAHANLGIAYGNLGRLPEAIDAYKQAIKIKPDFAKAYYNLGIAYGELGRSTEAIEAFSQAIKFNPNYAESRYNLGAAYAALDRWSEAIDAYKQAIRIKPAYTDAYNNLGIAYGRIGRYEDAIEAYKQAIKIEPDYVEAYYNLGRVFSNNDRWLEAIDAYKQTIKIKPDLAEAHNNLGIAYLAIGDKNSALAEYNILKSLNSELANDLLNQINK